MGGRLGQFIVILAALAAPACARPMSAKAPSPGKCHVAGADRLPAGISESEICAEIARAFSKHAPTARYSIEVKVLSQSRLSAALALNGRTLPVQNLAVSDGKVSAGSIRRFAESIAAAASAN